jgi:hypothetical protein
MNKITKKLREYTATLFILTGLGVVVLGGVIVTAGAWIGDITMVSDDLSDEELRQVIKEAEEASSRGEKR